LLLSDTCQDVKVLAVTSAVPREGKTSVAAQLALSFARATGEPTLLVDGDMRSPDLHHLFRVHLEPGLAQVLAGECSPEDAIVTIRDEQVGLLTAGRLGASPHRLLGTGNLPSLLAQLANRYCHIVMDTPPLLVASEALVMAKASDVCVLCVMRDMSRVSQVLRAGEMLASAGVRLAGVVLNGVSGRYYAYHYGSYPYVFHP